MTLEQLGNSEVNATRHEAQRKLGRLKKDVKSNDAPEIFTITDTGEKKPENDSGAVTVHTLDGFKGEVRTERFESTEAFESYMTDQFTLQEKKDYFSMNEAYEKMENRLEIRTRRNILACPELSFCISQLKAGVELPEHQMDAVRAAFAKITEDPEIQAFEDRYKGVMERTMDVAKKLPEGILSGVKDLVGEKDSVNKGLASLGIGLAIFTPIALETKNKKLMPRIGVGSKAFYGLLWGTLMARFWITDFGGTNGAELIGKGGRAYGRFVKGSFTMGENLLTSKGIGSGDLSNIKDGWETLTTGASPRQKNLEYIDREKLLTFQKDKFPGEIRAIIDRYLQGEKMRPKDITLAIRFRREAIHTNAANMGISLLDRDFVPGKPVTEEDFQKMCRHGSTSRYSVGDQMGVRDEDLDQAYASAAVKALDHIFLNLLSMDESHRDYSKQYLGAKIHHEQCPKEGSQRTEYLAEMGLGGITSINWDVYRMSGDEEMREQIGEQLSDFLDDYKSNDESSGFVPFSREGAAQMDFKDFESPVSKRTFLGLLMGGWLAATILVNSLGIARNLVGYVHGGYKDGKNESKTKEDTKETTRQAYKKSIYGNLYPKEVRAQKDGIYFVRKEIGDDGKSTEVRYPPKEESKKGWDESQFAQVLAFMKTHESFSEPQLKSIMSVFSKWKKKDGKPLLKGKNDYEGLQGLIDGNGQQVKNFQEKWKTPTSSKKISINGKDVTVNFKKGPGDLIKQLRSKFDAGALQDYLDSESGKKEFSEMLQDAKKWSLNPKILEATYEASLKRSWNGIKRGTAYMAGYTPFIPFIYHHNPTPFVGAKAREWYDKIGIDSVPWFAESLDETLRDQLLEPKGGESAPDTKRVRFKASLDKKENIVFVMPPKNKEYSVKPDAQAIVNFFKGSKFKSTSMILPESKKIEELFGMIKADKKQVKNKKGEKVTLKDSTEFEKALRGDF